MKQQVLVVSCDRCQRKDLDCHTVGWQGQRIVAEDDGHRELDLCHGCTAILLEYALQDLFTDSGVRGRWLNGHLRVRQSTSPA